MPSMSYGSVVNKVKVDICNRVKFEFICDCMFVCLSLFALQLDEYFSHHTQEKVTIRLGQNRKWMPPKLANRNLEAGISMAVETLV